MDSEWNSSGQNHRFPLFTLSYWIILHGLVISWLTVKRPWMFPETCASSLRGVGRKQVGVQGTRSMLWAERKWQEQDHFHHGDLRNPGPLPQTCYLAGGCRRPQRLVRAVQVLLAKGTVMPLEATHLGWDIKSPKTWKCPCVHFLDEENETWGKMMCSKSQQLLWHRNLNLASEFLPSPVLCLLCHQLFSSRKICQSPQKTTYNLTIILSFCICWRPGRKIELCQVINCSALVSTSPSQGG